MADAILWHTTTYGWSPRGYVLAVRHDFRDREAVRFEELLSNRLADARVTVFVNWNRPKEPGTGLIQLVGEGLLDIDPQRCRQIVAECADQARIEIEAAIQMETPQLDALRRAFKGGL